MKKSIALGSGLLLTLGTAVAGTLMYGQGPVEQTYQPISITTAASEVTPQMIAEWKATAASTDYIAPKVPI